MIKLRFILSFSLTLFLGLSVLSQENVSPDKTYISLSETIKLAQERSPDALINIHRFRRSYWEFRSFKAGYLPNVTINANASKILHVPLMRSPWMMEAKLSG